MKSKTILFELLFLTVTLISFTNKNEIGKCLISFRTASNLTADLPERLPESSDKFRTATTDDGEVNITRIDGYRVLYNNEKKVPFVNLKVELSDANSYEVDRKKILDNLRYINSKSNGMETKDLITLEFNGYKVFGLSRGAIESGSTLGIFAMFPGNDVTVY